MNEIVKKLAEQAVEESNLPAAFWWITQDPKMARVAERFAELIVKECILETMDAIHFDDSIRQRLSTHFGIKE